MDATNKCVLNGDGSEVSGKSMMESILLHTEWIWNEQIILQ